MNQCFRHTACCACLRRFVLFVSFSPSLNNSAYVYILILACKRQDINGGSLIVALKYWSQLTSKAIDDAPCHRAHTCLAR